MKLTLKQVTESQGALQHLMDQKLPIKVAYNLQRNMRLVLQEIENFNKLQSKLIREYGELIDGPNGTQYTVKLENREEYAKQIEELILTEIELEIRLTPLSALEGVDLTVRDVLLLSYLIEGEVT